MLAHVVQPVSSSVRPGRWWAQSLGRHLLGQRAPIALCYHGIGPTPAAGDPHGLFLPESAFADHLDLLRELGYRLVTASDLAGVVAARGLPGARGLAAVTLDDGLSASVHAAERLLGERDGRGTAFVLPGLLGCRHPHGVDELLLDGHELRAVADGGVLEIGSHSLVHRDLRRAAPAELLADLRGSRERLEAHLQRPVTALAYPFGRYGPDTMRAAEAAGYRSAWAAGGAAPWRPFALPREVIFPSTTLRRLWLKAAGLYGPFTRVAGWRNDLRRRVGDSP